MSEQQPPPWPPTPPLPGGWAPQEPPQAPPPGPGQQGPAPQGFEQPPHPALVQPQGGHAAHLSPHAASSGPQDGSRGAMLFAVAVALVVVACLVGALVLAAGA